MRTEFGFTRTECACKECSINCRFIPGYLVPSDIERIAAHVGNDNLLAFALDHLLASPGATVYEHNGQARKIPTLVPARRRDGGCKFLDGNNRCTIHAVSPFGCAFFDAHQLPQQSDHRSMRGLHEIDQAWKQNHLYALLWMILDLAGRKAPEPQIARAKLKAELAVMHNAA